MLGPALGSLSGNPLSSIFKTNSKSHPFFNATTTVPASLLSLEAVEPPVASLHQCQAPTVCSQHSSQNDAFAG